MSKPRLLITRRWPKAVEEAANFNANDYSPDASAIAQRRAQTS